MYNKGMDIRKEVNEFIEKIIKEINPYDVVYNCLKQHHFSLGDVYVIAIGKAAYTMSLAAKDAITNIKEGVVISKYNHIKSDIEGFKCFEAGHPISDENTIIATNYVLNLTKDLKEDDEVIFLISGGGSALFESPKVSLATLQDINNQLLKSGANINEINTIRKRLSNVKGGRFGKHISPAKVTSIILSDVIGDDLSSIASGPSVIDTNTLNPIEIVNKYNLKIDSEIIELLKTDTVKKLDNVENVIVGSVGLLCDKAYELLSKMGYETTIIQKDNTSEAKDVSKMLCDLAIKNQDTDKSLAFIVGGETTVVVKGNGLGGRNQELALNSAKAIADLKDTCIFALGSDGTDGPTDAAGGYVDNKTIRLLNELKVNIDDYISNNDAYNCLKQTNGLIITGPTGTNVNDIYVLLIRR